MLWAGNDGILYVHQEIKIHEDKVKHFPERFNIVTLHVCSPMLLLLPQNTRFPAYIYMTLNVKNNKHKSFHKLDVGLVTEDLFTVPWQEKLRCN